MCIAGAGFKMVSILAPEASVRRRRTVWSGVSSCRTRMEGRGLKLEKKYSGKSCQVRASCASPV